MAVKLYEAAAGKKAVPISPNPFTDTENLEILKANKLGITGGKGPGLFYPNDPITRQEISVMIVRAIKAVLPDITVDISGAESYVDEKETANWAYESLKFCSKMGVMGGVGQSKIDPLGNTTREQAILMLKRAYAKLYELFGDELNQGVTEAVKEDWPELVKHPSPFEKGYFTALDNPVLIASGYDVEVMADKGPITFYYPMDPYVSRTLMIYNKGQDEIAVEYSPKIDIDNFDEQLFINHPQPSVLYLAPGESHPIRLVYALQTGGPNIPKWDTGDMMETPLHVDLTIKSKSSIHGNKLSFSLENIVQVEGPGGPDFVEPAANATVSGTVYDSASSIPLSGIDVSVATGRTRIDTVTDSNGKFSVPVYTHKRGGTDQWNEFIVTVNDTSDRPQPPDGYSGENAENGFGQARRVVTIKAGETLDFDIVLKPVTYSADYSVDSILDIGLQAYTWDATADGEIMATVPFHTAYPRKVIEDESYLTVFNYMGELLWKYPIHGETPGLDVSRDGSYIATTINKQSYRTEAPVTAGGSAVVFDKEGNIVLEFDPQTEHYWWGSSKSSFVVVQISNDNKYLAAGNGDGTLYLIDIETGEVIWKSFTEGQVRKLAFDGTEEQVLYAGSGDGYLRAFDMAGGLKWKTYVDSWLTDMSISENHILTTSKSGRAAIHYIDKETGEYEWSYPVEQRGAGVAISPDESYVWYGHDIGGGSTSIRSTIFNSEGLPLYDLGETGQAAAITPDSSYIATKDGNKVALHDRNGQLLWKKNLAPDGFYGSLNHLIWISPDASRIVVALNNRSDGQYYGQLYFLSGGIKNK
ncbi:MAG: PQQ-binding-like beta-propeller repeat protein [Bacillota bacterium]